MQRRGGVLVLKLHTVAVRHGVNHRQIVPPDGIIVLVRQIGPLPETGNRQGPQARKRNYSQLRFIPHNFSSSV
jgi:hypothetical protein